MNMIGICMKITIISLWKQGKSKSEISRICGHDRKTVRRVINAYEQGSKGLEDRKVKYSKLDEHKEEVIKLLEKNLSGVRVYEELLKLGCRVSYPSIVRYIRGIKGKREICIRFHSESGEEAQVDFGYIGMQPDKENKIRKAWIFNMRLSYSRLDYYEVVFDQKVETFIRCHINAFKYFEGVPKSIKIDNLRAAILEANFYEPIYQKYYKKFAEYYQFNPLPCRVYQPQEKGKTESAIKYVKGNFFAGRKFDSFNQLKAELGRWLKCKCNSRIHGTTKRIPQELFELEEKDKLTKLPVNGFNFAIIGLRKLQRDCHIAVESNYYSAPYKYVGEELEIELGENLLRIFYNSELITTHERCYSKGQFITNRLHYPEYKLCMPSSPEYQEKCQRKLEEIGQSAILMFNNLLIKRPKDWNRVVSGIIKLGKTYDKTVVDLACARALDFELFSYSKIKSICQSGAYNLPSGGCQ